MTADRYSLITFLLQVVAELLFGFAFMKMLFPLNGTAKKLAALLGPCCWNCLPSLLSALVYGDYFDDSFDILGPAILILTLLALWLWGKTKLSRLLFSLMLADLFTMLPRALASIISRLIGKTQWCFNVTCSADIPWVLLNFAIYLLIAVPLVFLVSYLIRGVRFSTPEYWIGFVILLAMFALLNLFVSLTGEMPRDISFVVLLAYLLGTLCLVLLLMLVKTKRLSAEKQQLEALVRQQYEYYDAMQDYNLRIRKARHDIGNCLNAVARLAASGEDVSSYAKQLSDSLQPIYTIDLCDNRIVDAVLHSKLEQASLQQIKTHCQTVVPKETGIKDIELMRVFSNLLDNALEGCADAAGDRFIEIESALRAGGLMISVRNSCAEGAKLRSKKQDTFLHGLGTENVRSIAKSYGGSFEYTVSGGVFDVKVYIPFPAPAAAAQPV